MLRSLVGSEMCIRDRFHTFLRKGGRIFQLFTTNLLAVCVNPLSPEGARLDSGELVQRIQQAIEVPVYDIKRMKQ